MASAKSVGKLSASSNASKRPRYPLFAMCIDNRGYEGSLLVGKVYQIVRPLPGDGRKDVRVVDEEAEDYLYPADQFVPVELSARGKRALVVK
jgi:hypothetical protein